LRDFASDFNELTARIINELNEIHNSALPVQETSIRQNAHQSNSLEKYRQVQSASYRLYNTFALRWPCARHQKHAAFISLVEDGRSTRTQLTDTSEGIKFDVAINCGANSPISRVEPIWLEVESLDSGRRRFDDQKQHEATQLMNESECWTSVISNLTKYSQPMTIEKAEKAHRKLKNADHRSQPTATGLAAAVRTGETGTSTMTVVQTNTGCGGRYDNDKTARLSSTSSKKTAEPMVDLETVEDFCQYFQVPRPIYTHVCVGYIKDLSVHRFYLPSPDRRLPGKQKSLAEIISWISEEEIFRSIPRTALLRLASSLAVAVLQYHSTPWLPETWDSSHVFFFGISELTEDASGISLTSPRLRVEFMKQDKGKDLDLRHVPLQSTTTTVSTTYTIPNTTSSPVVSSTPNDPAASPLARNELLFRFGIMLLELGYSQPWPHLKQRVVTKLPHRLITDYYAAKNLAQAAFLRCHMGPRFPAIVLKCLGFGLEEDNLASEDLQCSFLVNVVGPLQEAERRWKELERRAGSGTGWTI
jgi:hypothetical protein